MKKKSKKIPLLPTIIAVAVAGGIFFIFLYSNIGLQNVFPFLQKVDPYQNKIVIFYGDGCEQCQTVSNFVQANNIEKKLPLVWLEVFKSEADADLLADKAQICGIPSQQIGVPFVWDGVNRKC